MKRVESNPSSSYQVLLSFREKKSSVLLDHQFFLSLKQQQYFRERLYIFTKITSNAKRIKNREHYSQQNYYVRCRPNFLRIHSSSSSSS